jgi:hypothetical protein
MVGFPDGGSFGGGGRGAGSDSDDDDDESTVVIHADSEEGSMGLEADAGTILEFAGDTGGGDYDSNASEDGGMGLDLRAGEACGDAGDGNSDEDGRICLDADYGAVLEVEGEAGDVGATIATHVRTPGDAASRP